MLELKNKNSLIAFMHNLSLLQVYPLISLIFILTLGLIVLKKNRKSKVGTLFFSITCLFSIWLFGTFKMLTCTSDKDIVFWDRFIYLGVVFMPAIQYHFSLIFTKTNKIRKALLIVAYVFSITFLFLSRTDYFVSGVFRYAWGVHTLAHMGHDFFMVFFFFYIFALLYNFIIQYVNTGIRIEKRKIVFLIASFSVLNLIGGIGYLPAYKISIYSPISLLAPLAFSIMMTYAIIVHRLMDIKLVMRRYSVRLVSIIIILSVALEMRSLAGLHFSTYANLVDFLILIFAVLTYAPIRSGCYRVANKYFFSSLYDSRYVIAKISDKLRSTLEINKISESIYDMLNKAFHMKSFAVLTFNQKEKCYYVQYNNGFNLGTKKKFSSDKYLYDRFIAGNEIILFEEIKNKVYDENTKKQIDILTALDVDVIAPLNVKNKTIGLLVFGAKESGDIYNEEDLEVLETVDAQVAIAIENAALYEETKNFNLKLKKEVEMATKELRSANEELKKLDQAKTDFLNIASHQLRTPISVIKGVASMFAEGDMDNLPPEKKQDFYQAIIVKSEKLEMIVHDIMNATSLTAKKYSVMDKEAETIDLRELIENILNDFNLEIEKRQLIVKLLSAEEATPKIRGQKEYLREAFINLLSNAIKYTPSTGMTSDIRSKRDERGVIKISLGRDPKNENNVLVKIKDNGIGIPADDLPRLFKKFSRAENAKNMYTDGTGIGLFVVKEVVDGHNGKVWVESELGKGSTFFVSLPIYSKEKVDVKKYILTN